MMFRPSFASGEDANNLTDRLHKANDAISLLSKQVTDLESECHRLAAEYTAAWVAYNSSPETLRVLSLCQEQLELMSELQDSSRGIGRSVQEVGRETAHVRCQLALAREKDVSSATAIQLATINRRKEANTRDLLRAQQAVWRAVSERDDIHQRALLCGAAAVEEAFMERERVLGVLGAHTVFLDVVAPFLQQALAIEGTDPRIAPRLSGGQ